MVPWSLTPKLFGLSQLWLLLSDISKVGRLPTGVGFPIKLPEVVMFNSPEADGNKVTSLSSTTPPSPATIFRVGGKRIGQPSSRGRPAPVISTALPARSETEA